MINQEREGVTKLELQGQSVSVIFSDKKRNIAKKTYIDITPEAFHLYINELKTETFSVVTKAGYYPEKVQLWVDEYANHIAQLYEHYKDEIIGLQYEGKVYADVLSKKYADHPNFLKFVSIEKTKFPAKYTQDDTVRSIIEKTDYLGCIIPTSSVTFHVSKENEMTFMDIPFSVFEKIIPKYFEICSINMQLVDPKKSLTLFDMISNNDKQVELPETRQALFQVIYTLKMMERDGLQHNDMHEGNVLVEILDKERTLTYLMDTGETVTFSTKYIAYVFDWNYAYSPVIGPNALLDLEFYKDIGILNQSIQSFDLYTLLSSINEHTKKVVRPTTSKGILFHLLHRSIYYEKIWWNKDKNCFDGFENGSFFVSDNGYMHRCNRLYSLHYFETISEVLEKITQLISQN